MGSHDFCRSLLRETMKEVRKHTTPEERKATWVYSAGYSGTCEFHGPNDFYWHGQADCKWDARQQGWEAWLRQNVVDGVRVKKEEEQPC